MLILSFAALSLLAHKQSAVIMIDASQQKPISPYVYGANSTDFDGTGIDFPVVRMGGNRLTAYNWENNASNAGSDWHNQNDSAMGETDEPGWAVKTFLEKAQKHGAAAIVTIQTIGRVAADKNPPGDVNQSPNYLETRFVKSYAKKPGGNYVYPPDATDNAVYEDEQVWWIEKIKSPATPVWFMLDNEPDIWAGTHSRIQTEPMTYAKIIRNNAVYASALKDVAPKALIFGPANYGWMGFHNFQNASDANGRDFLNVYLDAMKDEQTRQGRRILDVLDIHWYPEAQGGGIRVTEEGQGQPGLAAARIQAPRSLWDPDYVEQSWIANSIGNKPIQLIPTIQRQIAQHYPGTKLSISEYNYGGAQDASGLIAQADVLGIFGRYGVFAACNWGIGRRDPAELGGYRAFLNYDGKGSKFGDLGLAVTGETPESNSVYAAVRSGNPNLMTIVVINKTQSNMPLDLEMQGFKPAKAQSFTRLAGAFDQPLADSPAVTGKGVIFTAPPLSVTTIAVDGSG